VASIINTNVSSMTAQRNLTMNQGSLSTSIQRLSSGLRINSAKDDAAGLAIAERFTAQIRGSSQAGRNANDAISLAQTGEGALSTAGSILQRVRELAVQSANATNTVDDRKALNTESGALLAELDRIATSTQFNGQNILDGSASSSVFQVGANANQTISAATGNFRTAIYGAQLADTASVKAAATAANEITDITIAGNANATVSVVATDSAATVASKVNAVKDATGVSASARTLAEFKVTTAGTFSLSVKSNNAAAVNLTFSVGNNDSAGLAAAVDAFNNATAATGVSAKLNKANNGLILTNDSGANIDITNISATAAGTLAAYDANLSVTAGQDSFGDAFALAAATGTAGVVGSVQFNSSSGFSLKGTGATSYVGTTAVASTLNSVSSIDITTVDGSTRALKIVDSAISAVATQRAKFGALQSRFEKTVENLASTTENMTASRSRIQDADFAQETAALSRAQVLQQAGTAMIAQANQLPQGVLALLR
jgi:flagellin